MTISELKRRPLRNQNPRGYDLSGLKPGISLLLHDDGRQGTFVSIEPDRRLRVQSLKGRGFWVFHPGDVRLVARQDPATPPKPANRRQAAKATTRVRILDAARALFEAAGYAGASIRDIARAAGMSTGAVFATVPDKASLWRLVHGGPAPSDQIADEIARVLGQLPDHGWVVAHRAGAGGRRFHARIATPDFDPIICTGLDFVGYGDSPAAALRQAREDATHALRQEAS